MKKKPKKQDRQKRVESKTVVKEIIPPSEKTFDFGGIPERDLKKNLGCS